MSNVNNVNVVKATEDFQIQQDRWVYVSAIMIAILILGIFGSIVITLFFI